MTRLFRVLSGENSTASVTPPPAPASSVDSDYVVILAALLCALICVLGLIAVARCAWLRRLSGGGASTNPGGTSTRNSPANKGMKKKILRTLPKQTFTSESATRFTECAICLTEFIIGEEIRVLPQCGHGFHVTCIDTWLGSHSSCPSCRQILVVARCQKCGGFPATSSSTSVAGAAERSEARSKEREDDPNRFLP